MNTLKEKFIVLMYAFSLFGLLSVVSQSVASAQAATIVWVSFHGADDAPSAGASSAGFTEAPDKGYTDLLAANGYDVMRYITTGTPDPAVLNAADLVIISRSVSSAYYQNVSATMWNSSISAPMIIVNGYTLRYSRMGYTSGENIPDTAGDITLTINNPTHPIFTGIPITDGIMTNPYAGLAVYPDGAKYQDGSSAAGVPAKGISINTDPVNANGTVLATISPAGNGPIGCMVIAEWQAGATLTHPDGMGGYVTDTLAGHRLVLHYSSSDGYSRLSFILASAVVNCQFTLASAWLRLFSQAFTSFRRVSTLSIRCDRHCRPRTPSSISAMSSQLPCLGV